MFGRNSVFFVISLSASCLSGLIALTKYLARGPLAPVPETRIQSGIVWISAFVAVSAVGLSKGISWLCNPGHGHDHDDGIRANHQSHRYEKFIPLFYLPHLILALFGVGWNQLSMVLKHPIVVLVPMYTPFAYTRFSSDNRHDNTLCLSVPLTVVNVILHLLQIALPIPFEFGTNVYTNEIGTDKYVRVNRNLEFYSTVFGLTAVPLVLSTAAVLLLTKLGMPYRILRSDHPDETYLGIRGKMFLKDKKTGDCHLLCSLKPPPPPQPSISNEL